MKISNKRSFIILLIVDSIFLIFGLIIIQDSKLTNIPQLIVGLAILSISFIVYNHNWKKNVEEDKLTRVIVDKSEDVYNAICSNCKNDITPTMDMPYCPYCGKELDWSDIK